jgi:two-component system response regulator
MATETAPGLEAEILLVEDNPNDVALTLHALRRHNLAGVVQVVRDGEEALDFLFCAGSFVHRSINEAPPKLILLDLKLPKLHGMEVLQRLKANPRTRSIPVVILTSSDEETDMLKGYGLGVNSYVVKPVDFEKFTHLMQQLGLYWLLVNRLPRQRS